MSTITLPNIRVSSDLTVKLKLKDGGVAIDWSTLQNIKVGIHSDAQRAKAGNCGITIDAEDPTILVCTYAANKPQYLGVNRVIVTAKYRGETKTYDKPAFNFVRWTDDQAGEQITIDDPDVDVEISVEDISSSILQEAVDEAFTAADRANDAAAAAEHMVDIHTGPEGKSAYEVAVEEGYTGTEEEWLASLKGPVGETPDISIGTVTTVEPGTPAAASMSGTPEAPVLNLSIPKGLVGATPNFTVGTVTTGEPGSSVIVTITGTPEAPVLNLTIPQGMQGNTGSSVDYPYELVNNLTTNDATKGLSAAQGVVLDGKVSQLEAEVNGTTETTEVLTPKSLTADKTYNTNVSTMATSPSDNEGYYCTRIAVTPGEVYRLSGVKSTSKYTLLFATANSSRARLRRDEQGDGSRVTIDVTIETDEAWLYVNLGSYDSATDGVWKVTEETVHTDGLVDDIQDLDERVTAIEETPAAGVVDSLNSTSATDALSANQGRVLNEDINGVTTITWEEQEILVGRYCNTSLSRITSKQYLPSGDGVACVYAYVSPGDVFRIYGKGNAVGYQLYAMADADRYIVENGKPGVAMDTRENPLDLTIPAGVARLVVNLYEYDPLTDKVEKRITTTSESVKTRLADLERETAEITALALPLSGKKVMILGDSIFEFSDEDEKGVTDYFAEYSLANVLKGAVGGTRLVQRAAPVETPTTTTQAYAALDICNIVKAWSEADYTKQDAAVEFLDRYAEQIATLKANPISGVDYVIIGGGTNDITNESPIGTETESGFTTLWGAFNEMVNLLLTANPKLKIFFASPIVGYRASARTEANWDDNYVYSSGMTKPQYIELFSQMAGKSHIPYIDLYFTAGVNQVNFSEYFIDSDNRHPYKGFDLYARRLYQRVLANLM